MNTIHTELPRIYTVEFYGGDVVHITCEDRELARAFAIVDRYHKALNYNVKSLRLREWVEI